MKVSRINIDGVETLISLGIDEDKIETYELRDGDTIELDEIIDKVKNINNEKN